MLDACNEQIQKPKRVSYSVDRLLRPIHNDFPPVDRRLVRQPYGHPVGRVTCAFGQFLLTSQSTSYHYCDNSKYQLLHITFWIRFWPPDDPIFDSIEGSRGMHQCKGE